MNQSVPKIYNVYNSLTFYSFLIFIVFGLMGCKTDDGQKADPLFQHMPAQKTSVNFSNDIKYDKKFSILNFSYIYNGGGVAAGDINNDGLPDLYFTGNMVSSCLYLNKGNFEFKDITKTSGTSTTQWAGGVSMVDINNDGFLDIYISVNGPENSTPEDRQNLLFINRHDNTFTESAAQYGLADTGYTTQTVFLDYDKDGDLDAFLIDNYAGSFSRDGKIRLRIEVNNGTSKSTDKLYRNNGDGTFTNVSKEAGILKEGYSLGVAVSDINNDGWPDIYISNDVQTDDLLYINNGDGTFTDKASQYLKHTSNAGMGTDITDFNNDSWPDIVQVDMKPMELNEQQLSSGTITYDYLQELKRKGYQPQYTSNSLQLSNGRDSKGNIIFSEIGQFAGISGTNWSWSSLFGDFDNDGLKDLVITNGYPKAANNYDYLMQLNRSVMFGTDSSRAQRRYEAMDSLRPLKMVNYFFKNKGYFTFSDVSAKWGFSDSTFSYGAAYADLDNDGDLDLAINNINGKAGIFKNRADSLLGNHYLKISLQGDSLNSAGIGTKLTLFENGKKQYQYFNPYRGYQSSMGQKIIFGLDSTGTVDSLQVAWPDGHYQLLTHIKTNQVLTLRYKDAGPPSPKSKDRSPLVKETDDLGINYKHEENNYIDFHNAPLLPRMLSRLGPAVAVGDVNNDNREDLFLGGAAGFPCKLFLQQKDNTFIESTSSQPWEGDKAYEDTDAIFLDVNGDKKLDLYVVSGGNAYSPASQLLQDRLYLNTGNGTFVKAGNMLPRMYTSGSVVKAADYDNDGDMDLFVAGRHIPGKYPMSARSYILKNDKNRFIDVTAEVAPALVKPGLITDATWVDFNEDGALDLVTTGIWMPVSFFENRNGHLKNITSSAGIADQRGWWQSLEKTDIDGDGDLDFIAGNFGLNFNYGTSGHEPLYILAKDFNHNTKLDAVMAIKKDGSYYPVHGMRSMKNELPRFMQQISSFGSYAGSPLSKILRQNTENEVLRESANYFASSVIINKGDGRFSIKSLPSQAQLSSVNDILVFDINGDSFLDLILAGNIYNTNPEFVQNDAGNGLILLGDGKGDFAPLSPFASGFMAPLNVRKLALLKTDEAAYILVINNDDKIQFMKIQPNLIQD